MSFIKNKWILISRTLSAHWFDLVGTLGSYSPRKWWKLKKFRFFKSFLKYATCDTAQLGFCGRYELSQLFPTPPKLLVWPENHFGVVYSEKIMKIWIISVHFDHFFEVYATDNTAQLGFCGVYELSHVFPTPLCYWFDLRTTLQSFLFSVYLIPSIHR